MDWRYWGIVLGGIYAVVFVFVGFVLHKIGDFGGPTGDFLTRYVPAAATFLKGELSIDILCGPAYSIALGLVRVISGDFLRAGILLSIASASFALVLNYETMRNLFDNRTSMLGTGFLMLNPIYNYFSFTAGSDMFFNFLVCSILYLFFKDGTIRWPRSLIIGLLIGTAYLTRYNGVFLLVVIPIILFINFWNLAWKARLLHSLIIGMAFCALFSSWGFYCLEKRGSFFINDNYINVAYCIYSQEIGREEFMLGKVAGVHSMTDVVMKNPARFMLGVGKNLYEHFLKDMSKVIGWPVGSMVICGLIYLLIFRHNRRIISYLVLYCSGYGVILLVFYEFRYSLFLVPFYSLFAACIILFVACQKHRLIKLAACLAGAGLLGASLYGTCQFNKLRIDSEPREVLEMSAWFLNTVPANERGKIIMARKPHIAYYMGLEFRTIPLVSNENELLAIMKREQVDYLYFSSIEAYTRRSVANLLNPTIPHKGLWMMAYNDDPLCVLYRVEK